MPLPFILAGAALLASGYGIKKGIDAKSDYDSAKYLKDNAKEIFDEAKASLEKKRSAANSALDDLGRTKFDAYREAILPFFETFSKIKNVNFHDNSHLWMNELPTMSNEELLEMKSNVLVIKEVVSGGVTALGSGGLAGLAAYGGVGLLGTASTGTAIGTLTGAAATNATLAWLGGGSLAAGGFGMAGGMAVLGGIVAGPVLAVGGMMLASKAEAALQDAYADHCKAELAVEELKSAGVATDGITKRLEEMSLIITKVKQIFSPMINSLNTLVSRNEDYDSYTDDERKGVFIVASTAKTLKNLIDTPIIDGQGVVTGESRKAIEAGNEFFTKLSAS